MILYTTKIAVKMVYIFGQKYPECIFTRYTNRKDHMVLVDKFDYEVFVTFRFDKEINYSHSFDSFFKKIYDYVTNVRPATI